MRHHIMCCIIFLLTFLVSAQTINVSGKVTNKAGSPIANAIVTLIKQAMKDTTGADGTFKISKSTGIVLPFLKPHNQSITLYKSFLDFSLTNPYPVKIEVFDVQGNLLQKVLLQNASTGFYRFNIAENSRTAKLLVIKASIGRQEVTLRYLPLKNGEYTTNQFIENATPVEKNGLTKITAINDTLKTTATGYTANTMAISSYDQKVTINLDTAGGGARPSAGCGKPRTLPDSSSATISVSGAGNRLYILDIPHDYDPNQPYALWFSLHCMNGTAEGVAHGSFGTNYQYYGMRKFTNPPNGKGTTIFCAAQGIGNAWGQGANDLNFFRAMITKFENELCIDQSRIFSEGFSMGGSMSYALACAMPDTFRAVCMHEGGSMSGCEQSHRGPVPMFITIGTEDAWPSMGTPQLKDLAQRNGCTPMDITTANPTDNMHPVCLDYKGCNPGYPCRACVFKGGHDPSPGTQGAWGEGNTWVDDSTWSFFKQFY